ncbi:MAG: hypothetical protein R6V01_03195 [Thermoplasmatota archaeon]
MGNRFLFMVALMACIGSVEGLVTFDEDTSASYDLDLSVLFPRDTPDNISFEPGEGLEVELLEGGALNISSSENWNGASNVTLSNGSAEFTIDVEVIPVNDAPVILEVIGPENLTDAENPLVMTVVAEDVEGDEITVEWFLQDEEDPVVVSRTFRRWVYPGTKILRVRVSDPHGANETKEFVVSMKTPPGMEEGPDNIKNRVIFWTIFGSAGLIFGLLCYWIMMGKERGANR